MLFRGILHYAWHSVGTQILVNATELVGRLVEVLEDRYYSYFATEAALTE